MNNVAELDNVFSALSDSTRRSILEQLKEKELTIVEIASSFNMSFQAVAKHVKILNNAGLITKQRDGKFYKCSYNPEPLQPALNWISTHYQIWKDSFNSLEAYLNNNSQE